jgi:hypothetical protein
MGREGTSEAAEKGTRIHEALEVRDSSALHDEEETEIYEQIVKMEDEFLSGFPAGRVDKFEIQLDIELDYGLSTFGTCDRFTYWPAANSGLLGDYKTGVSVIDPPAVNWQTKCYVIGAFQKEPEMESCGFVFYVPFHDGSEVGDTMYHTFYRTELPTLIKEVSDAIREARRVRAHWTFDENGKALSQPPLSDLGPSVDCRFCAREEHCPAMGALICEVAKVASPKAASKLQFDPTSQDPTEIEKRYLVAKIVIAWAEREKRAAVDMAKDGVEFPSLKLASMGSPRYVSDKAYFTQIAAKFGVDITDIIEEVSIPLTKISKLIEGGKEKQEEFLDRCDEAGIIGTSAERFTLKAK